VTAAAEPLPARSVLLSVLLGSHPPRLPVRTLVRTAELFGISDGTARVALSRLTADGEVVAEDGTYGLSERHLDRQRDQDAALRPRTKPWRGGWVLGVVVGDPEARLPAAAPDARREMERRRMAEVRPGVWTRPDNLVTPPPPAGPVQWWTARPAAGGSPPATLARRLWDLAGWSERAEELTAALESAAAPADRLAVAAAMVRHIRSDPVLPPALLPAGWPGRSLRRAYDGYRTELSALIAARRAG